MRFEELFPKGKPIIGMIHLKGTDHADKLSRAKLEADMLIACGVDALMIENFYGDAEDVENTLRWLHAERPKYCYGVNVIDEPNLSCDLAEKYGAKLVQINSVCGHLNAEEDKLFEKEGLSRREGGSFLLLGGVHFGGKEVLSGRSLSEDIKLGMERCDAIVVTGSGIGVGIETDKIREFHKVNKAFPIIVGAGVTTETAKEKLFVADGAIVGSAFKDNGKPDGEVSEQAVKEFMDIVISFRSALYMLRRLS